jgi:hypothetical protein
VSDQQILNYSKLSAAAKENIDGGAVSGGTLGQIALSAAAFVPPAPEAGGGAPPAAPPAEAPPAAAPPAASPQPATPSAASPQPAASATPAAPAAKYM